MRTLHLSQLTAAFLLLLSNSLTAQITVPFSTIAADYEIGTMQQYRANDTIKTYDIGKPGGGNVWDFSGITFSTETVSEVLDPADAPFAENYPDANRVTLVQSRIPIPTTSGGTDRTLKNTYLFTKVENKQVLSLGSITRAPMSFELGDIVSTFNPPVENFPDPITYGNAQPSNGTSSITISFAGIPITADGIYFSNKNIDAYGTIILPDGETNEALRIQDQIILETILDPEGTATIIYTFLMQDGSSVAIAVEGQDDSGTGTVQGSFSWVTTTGEPVTTSVADSPKAREANFQKISPNPFTNELSLEYEVVESGEFSVRILDVTGRPLKVIDRGWKNRGVYRFSWNGEDLASGLYFVELQTQSGKLVRKILKY